MKFDETKLILIISGFIMSIDWFAKTIQFPQSATIILKWVFTISYPLIAIYLFTAGATADLNEKEKNVKFNKYRMLIFKYFLLFAGILLLPSVLLYWFNKNSLFSNTIKVAVQVIYPPTIFALLYMGFTIKTSMKSNKIEKIKA